MTANEQQPLWGGGDSMMHPALDAISVSLRQDMPLAEADLKASAAYARALGKCGVLSIEDGEALSKELLTIRGEYRKGEWRPDGFEDVHTAIEAEVTQRLGDLGARLHTGRSRNDQVATAFRLTVMGIIDDLAKCGTDLLMVILNRAEDEIDTLMSAYTHLQRAQPIRLAHWLMSYFWPLERDLERLMQLRQRVAVLPLGVGAVSGHPFDIDRNYLADELGFDAISENSLDTVGDRDFAIEFVFACSLIGIHLSRMSEDLVVWSSAEFGFIKWPSNLATGSSLMPNKKNPDLPELVRGRAAQPIGDLMTLLTLMKGLPTSYQRDLQEDKQPVWRSNYVTRTNLLAMTAAIDGVVFNGDALSGALSDDILATELADLLVGRGEAFRTAYRAVSCLVARVREGGGTLKEYAASASPEELKPFMAEDILNCRVEDAIERRTTPGGTAREAVELQFKDAQEVIDFYRDKFFALQDD